MCGYARRAGHGARHARERLPNLSSHNKPRVGSGATHPRRRARGNRLPQLPSAILGEGGGQAGAHTRSCKEGQPHGKRAQKGSARKRHAGKAYPITLLRALGMEAILEDYARWMLLQPWDFLMWLLVFTLPLFALAAFLSVKVLKDAKEVNEFSQGPLCET